YIQNMYTVTWKNYDVSTLKSEYGYHGGDLPYYGDEIPIKYSDEYYDYIFKGWSPEIKPIDEDVDYVAIYEASKRTYEVIWMNDNGDILKVSMVDAGELPLYDLDTSLKESTAEYQYEFMGWNKEIIPITIN